MLFPAPSRARIMPERTASCIILPFSQSRAQTPSATFYSKAIRVSRDRAGGIRTPNPRRIAFTPRGRRLHSRSIALSARVRRPHSRRIAFTPRALTLHGGIKLLRRSFRRRDLRAGSFRRPARGGKGGSIFGNQFAPGGAVAAVGFERGGIGRGDRFSFFQSCGAVGDLAEPDVTVRDHPVEAAELILIP